MIRSVTIFVFIFSVIALSVASAHLEKGTYKGSDQNGNPCSFDVGDTWFDLEFAHPLTERVPLTKIKFMALKPKYDLWQMGHPAMVQIEAGKVGYNHDLIQDVIPTFTGAASVTLYKSDTNPAKPRALVYMEEHYKNRGTSKKAVCNL